MKSILSGLGLTYKFEDFDRLNNLVFMDTASKLMSLTYIVTNVSMYTILNTFGEINLEFFELFIPILSACNFHAHLGMLIAKCLHEIIKTNEDQEKNLKSLSWLRVINISTFYFFFIGINM